MYVMGGGYVTKDAVFVYTTRNETFWFFPIWLNLVFHILLTSGTVEEKKSQTHNISFVSLS